MKHSGTGISSRVTILLLGLAFAVSVALTTSGAQKPRRSAATRNQVVVAELHSVDQLKDAFERDRGKMRLVALLSPT